MPSVKRAAEIINNILYITIASANEDGKPWNSPVYSAFDSDLNFYWTSDKNAQHSQNVRSREDIFIVIYDSTVAEGTGEGVYIQAKAVELTDHDDILKGRIITQGRKGKNVSNTEALEFMDEGVRRIYRATPLKVWMNDDEKDPSGKFIRDWRVSIPLGELKDAVSELV